MGTLSQAIHPDSTKKPSGLRLKSWRRAGRHRKQTPLFDCINNLYDTPLLRGKIHIVLFLATPIWGTYMIKQCSTTQSTVVAAISIIACVFNFGSSAMLHNVHWISVSARAFWRRLDHMGIFAMIIGSAIPVPILAFSFPWKIAWLCTQGLTICLAVSLCYFNGDRFSNQRTYGSRALIYVILGLLNLVFVNEFRRSLTSSECAMLAGLAAAYCIGAAMYGKKGPNPIPNWIGYHECFHIFCLISAALTFCLNLSVIKRYDSRSLEIRQTPFRLATMWTEMLTVILMPALRKLSSLCTWLVGEKFDTPRQIAGDLSPDHSAMLRQVGQILRIPSTPILMGSLSARTRRRLYPFYTQSMDKH